MPTDKTKFEYNLQPYRESGDTTGRRDLTFYSRNIIKPLNSVIGNRKVVIDLGCGNGRMNTIIGDMFEEIICVDPVDELDPKFELPNTTYIKAHVENIPKIINKKVDIVIMIGSMHSIWRTHGNKTINYLADLINHDGLICTVSDIKHEQDLSSEFNLFEKVENFIFDDNKTSLGIFKKI